MTFTFSIFIKLSGSWILSRTVPNYGTMKGRAVFKVIPKENNFLHYREEGIMILEQTKATYDFFREYIYEYSRDAITIYFSETPRRIFQVLNLGEFATCEAAHQCVEDDYHGTYNFKNINQGQFEITYKVKGPNKDYVIVSKYIKESE